MKTKKMKNSKPMNKTGILDGIMAVDDVISTKTCVHSNVQKKGVVEDVAINPICKASISVSFQGFPVCWFVAQA